MRLRLESLSWHFKLIRICSTGRIINLVSCAWGDLPWMRQYKGPESLSSRVVKKAVPDSATQSAEHRGEFRFGVVEKRQARRPGFFYKGNYLVNLWEGSEFTIVLLELTFYLWFKRYLYECLVPEVEQGYFSFQNSTVTIEEFHCKLQEATNFPLRPFVIPFLKVIVTRELLNVIFYLNISSGSATDPCCVIKIGAACTFSYLYFSLGC